MWSSVMADSRAGSLHSHCTPDSNLCAKWEPFWAGLSEAGLYMQWLSDSNCRLGRESSPLCGLISHQQQCTAPSFYHSPWSCSLRNDHCLHPLLFWKMAKVQRKKSPGMSEESRITEKGMGAPPEALGHPRAHCSCCSCALL